MLIVPALLGSLIPLAVIVGLVVLVVWLVRRSSASRADPHQQGRAVRRLYLYGAALVGLIVGTVGLVRVLQTFIEAIAPEDVLLPRTSAESLAIGLSMLLVGGTVWGLHWAFIRRSGRANPAEEQASAVRKAYLYLLAFVAVAVLAAATVSLFRWALGAQRFSGYPFAALLCWGVVWGFHWRTVSREALQTRFARLLWQLYIYITAIYTLGLFLTGVGGALVRLLTAAYDEFSGDTLLPGPGLWSDPLQGALALAIGGGALWGLHWLYLARADRATAGRAFTSYAITLGGTLTILAAVVVLAVGLIWWFLAAPGDLRAVPHFRFLPGMVVTLAIGVGLTSSHRHDFLTRAGALGRRAVEARRATVAVLAFLGLAGLASAVVAFVPLLIGAPSETARGVLVNPDWWRAPVTAGLVSLVIGAPLWAILWFPWERQVDRGDKEVRHNLSRRIYLYLVVGVATLALIGATTHVLFTLLRDGLDGELGLTWLREAKWSIGVVMASLLIAPYHWLLLRGEGRAPAEFQPREAPAAGAALTEVALVAAGRGIATLEGVLAVLGENVTVAQRLEAGEELGRFAPGELASLLEAVRAEQGRRVLVVLGSEDIRLYTY